MSTTLYPSCDMKILALEQKLARADARIAELERECSQWRDELRIYRETESKRIAELEQSVTVRDTEVARLRNKINSMLEILSDELPKATRRRVGARFNAELDNKP